MPLANTILISSNEPSKLRMVNKSLEIHQITNLAFPNLLKNTVRYGLTKIASL